MNEFNHLIGKTLRTIQSSFLISEFYENNCTPSEYRMDYNSTLLIDTNDLQSWQKIEIKSSWHQNIQGQDILNLKIENGTLLSSEDILKMRMPYPSSLSFGTGFTIDKIELFGYNLTFNRIEATMHILLLQDAFNRKILLRPETAKMGLIITLCNEKIEAFFDNSFNHELIYRVE